MAVEEPAFTAAMRDGAFEVRDYPAMIAAEVTVPGDQGQAVNRGFRLLAGYIFGGNAPGRNIPMTAPVTTAKAAGVKIPMTAPVVQTQAADGWVVRFIMPRNSSLETLPRPTDARVSLRALPATRVAVLRFSGVARAKDFETRSAQLAAWIGAHGLHSAGPPTLAQYDPPWTPWFVRRNEILTPVEK